MKKRLVGGEYLLDLTPITIAESVDGETYTNITNEDVIEQLTDLKEFIRNPKAIKPVWVKFVNDEDDAVIVTRGSLSIVDDGEFDIDVSINGYTLKIHIEFTQATLSDSTPIDDWYIDTNDAKYLFTSDAQNISPIVEDVIESAESGIIADVLGLDSEGGLVKGTISGGTKLYKHLIRVEFSSSQYINFILFSNYDNEINTNSLFKTFLLDTIGFGKMASHLGMPYSKYIFNIIGIDSGVVQGYTLPNYIGAVTQFYNNSFLTMEDNHSGGYNLIIYPADSIDITTGNLKTRTATLTLSSNNATITDTVTEL